MKKNLLLILLLFSITSFSQEIKFEKGKYYMNGKQLSTRETSQLLNTNYKASELFQSARNKETFGGFLLGFGIGFTLTDLAMGAIVGKKYPSTFTYLGVTSMVVSIPVLVGRKKKFTQAIDIYNKENNNLGSTNLKLNAITNENGVGFQIQF